MASLRPTQKPGAANNLALFLDDPSRPSGTLSYHELQGFFFAVATSPELVRPSEWLPIVFGGKEANYASLAEAQRILPALMALYNDVNASVRSAQPGLPPDCRFHTNVQANFEEDAPVSRWSRGFTHGYQWLRNDWDGCVPDEYDHDFSTLIMTLSFFANKTLATAYLREIGTKDVKAAAVQFRRLFPEALAEFARIARLIQDVLLMPVAEAEPSHPKPKVGRNDPCSCGSGRKYKKCCGANVTH